MIKFNRVKRCTFCGHKMKETYLGNFICVCETCPNKEDEKVTSAEEVLPTEPIEE